jgi:hypothetical protein
MKKLGLILLATAAMVGCKVNDEKAKDSPAKQFLGNAYELVYVHHRNNPPENKTYVSHELFTLLLADEKLITGKDVCYNYNSDVEWGNDGFVFLSNYGQTMDPSCRKGDITPFAMQAKMKYVFTPSRIYLYSEVATSDWDEVMFTRTNY